jgi:hypothetical protein
MPVILAIGVRPEVSLARAAGLVVGARGGIAVDERIRTSDPDIYAVGDAVEVRDVVIGQEVILPLAGPANRQGRVAAEAIAGRATRFRGVQRTAIVSVFGLTVACTGASEKGLRRAGVIRLARTSDLQRLTLQVYAEIMRASAPAPGRGHARQVDQTMGVVREIIGAFGERLAQVHLSELDTRCHHQPLSVARVAAVREIRHLIPDTTVILESQVPAVEIETTNFAWLARASHLRRPGLSPGTRRWTS